MMTWNAVDKIINTIKCEYFLVLKSNSEMCLSNKIVGIKNNRQTKINNTKDEKKIDFCLSIKFLSQYHLKNPALILRLKTAINNVEVISTTAKIPYSDVER